MGGRTVELKSLARSIHWNPFSALRTALKEGYGKREFHSDLRAAMFVVMVNVPLTLVCSVAAGLPPAIGIRTAILAGILTALLGGSRFQVSAPAVPVVAVLVALSGDMTSGVQGLFVTTLLTGVLLASMGLFRLSRLLEFLPFPLMLGLSVGMAAQILAHQLAPALGIHVLLPNNFFERLVKVGSLLSSVSWNEGVLFLVTVLCVRWIPKATQSVPAPLVALVATTLCAMVMGHWTPLRWVDVGEYFASRSLDDVLIFLPPLSLIGAVMPTAFALAVWCAYESTENARAADGQKGKTPDIEGELFAQGFSNIVSSVLGAGISTSSLPATATNVRSGAVSPVASILQGAMILALWPILSLGVNRIPMSVIAGVMVCLAWNFSAPNQVARMLRIAPRTDAVLFWLGLFFTLILGVTTALVAGIVVAAVLFMRRMADIGMAHSHRPSVSSEFPSDVVWYHLEGPMFFAAAHRALHGIRLKAARGKVVLLDFSGVPVIDMTGLLALENVIQALKQVHATVILVNFREQPTDFLTRVNLDDRDHGVYVFRDLETAREQWPHPVPTQLSFPEDILPARASPLRPRSIR